MNLIKNNKNQYQIFLLIIVSIILAACNGGKSSYRALSKDDRGNTKYRGHYKVGKPYEIKGKQYRPKECIRYTEIGMASWYGKRYGFHGKKTANGDVYNKEMLTAAHKTLPLPSLVKITNQENGKSIIVLVNDRGPFSGNRIVDLSERAASFIGMREKGIAKVKVTYLHNETKNFLKTLGIKKKTGACAKSPLKNKKCTVNCHIKLINMKYKLMK